MIHSDIHLAKNSFHASGPDFFYLLAAHWLTWFDPGQLPTIDSSFGRDIWRQSACRIDRRARVLRNFCAKRGARRSKHPQLARGVAVFSAHLASRLRDGHAAADRGVCFPQCHVMKWKGTLLIGEWDGNGCKAINRTIIAQ